MRETRRTSISGVKALHKFDAGFHGYQMLVTQTSSTVQAGRLPAPPVPTSLPPPVVKT